MRRITPTSDRRPPLVHHADTRAAELPDALQFMRLLWALVHGLQRRSKLMTRQLGVTGPQRLVLRIVSLLPGISAGTLAGILHVHPSTLTGVLQRLVAQGLLKRSIHATDRRRVVLFVTPKGARSNAARSGTVEAAVIAVLARVTPLERDVTQRVLQLLSDGLNLRGGAPKRPRAPSAAPRRGWRARTR